jgi:hypothetical protein
MPEEVRSRFNLGNLRSFRFRIFGLPVCSKNMKIKIYRIRTLPGVLSGRDMLPYINGRTWPESIINNIHI